MYSSTLLNRAGYNNKNKILHLLLLGYAVFFSINGAFSPVFLGYPLFSAFALIFYFIVLLYSFPAIARSDNKIIFLLYFVAALCMATSYIKGWSPVTSVFNVFIYIIPILLFWVPKTVKFNVDFLYTVVQIITAISTVITFLIYFGYIDSTLDGFAYNLNIAVVDNTIGLLGLATSMYMLINPECKRKISAILTVVCSLIIVFFGQSRARIILSVFIIAVFLLYILFAKGKNKFVSLVSLLVVVAVIVFIISRNSDLVSEYSAVSSDKFSANFSDGSSVYRIDETLIHFDLLKENPMFGIGSGALNNDYDIGIDDKFYGHNMLSTVFALNGLLFGILFIISYFKIVFKVFNKFFNDRSLQNLYALILMAIILFLSLTSAGFSKYSTHLLMLIIGVFVNKQEITDIFSSKGAGGMI